VCYVKSRGPVLRYTIEMPKLNEKNVREKLLEVYDPEMNISIVDLGLVYDVTIQEKKVNIKMTLTTLGCPLFPVIEKDILSKLKPLGPTDVTIKLTFDPPWSFEKMSEKAKAMLGL